MFLLISCKTLNVLQQEQHSKFFLVQYHFWPKAQKIRFYKLRTFLPCHHVTFSYSHSSNHSFIVTVLSILIQWKKFCCKSSAGLQILWRTTFNTIFKMFWRLEKILAKSIAVRGYYSGSRFTNIENWYFVFHQINRYFFITAVCKSWMALVFRRSQETTAFIYF